LVDNGFVFTGDRGQPLDPRGAIRDAFMDLLNKDGQTSDFMI